MKRFFTFLFVITSLICYGVGRCQEQTNNNELKTPSPALEQQYSGDEGQEPNQKNSAITYDKVIRDEGALFVERLGEIASKANWALLISIFATIFSGLAWLTGKQSNRIAEKSLGHTRLSERGWLDIVDIELTNYTPPVRGIRESFGEKFSEENLMRIEEMERQAYHEMFGRDFNIRFKVENVGKSTIANPVFKIKTISVGNGRDQNPSPRSYREPFVGTLLPIGGERGEKEFTHTYRFNGELADGDLLDLSRDIFFVAVITYNDGVTKETRSTRIQYVVGPLNGLAIGENRQSVSHT